ncbi:GNAT family N-acetyltransferase [Corynebacterium freneyi]|uniref:N-acetylglutamate synthase, CG3035 family n=1 Tax=Corynebacterium freneyi TaxID=134034 RepID=UPI00254F8AB2|nr:GNAT family N-acetyltransferase [Corynebacterium freneyi]MDK8767481.1 GNAT family N-acetyltransferase [Corynebacterium freneyi]
MSLPEYPDTPGLPASRWGAGDIEVGRRVIVRRELTPEEAAATGKKVTDVIGRVESVDPLVVRPTSKSNGGPDGTPAEPVDFTDHKVLVVKALPDLVVRNSDIRAVETATAKAFPGIEHRWAGQWLLRAGDGITERSNSALPIGPAAGTSPVPLDDIREFYARHGLPVRIAVPDRICRPAEQLVSGEGWEIGPEIIVMTRSADDLPEPVTPESLPGIRAEVLDQPDEQWLALYHFRGRALPRRALQLLRDDIDGRMSFGRLVLDDGDGDARTVAITRGTLTESGDGRRWLGFSAVEVAPDLRRRGLGTLMGLHMMHWGAANGADECYLQVVSGNEAGIALYRSLGFGEHHRHRYAVWNG